MLPSALQTLIDELSKLPGVGPRTAERLAIYILRNPKNQSSSLASALDNLHEQISFCEVCHNLTENPVCPICQDSRRTQSVICVVEDALDVLAVERTSSYHGLYHVLGGAISPIDGIGPEQLNIHTLLKRIGDGTVEELIIATNSTTEGEATAMFIQKQPVVSKAKVKVTRLASGLPIGSDLEYADQITLGRALENRQVL